MHSEKLRNSSPDNAKNIEIARKSKHSVLFTESTDSRYGQYVVSGWMQLICAYADELKIPTRLISHKHLYELPVHKESAQTLLHTHSGFILHNLSLTDLELIREFLLENKEKISRMVIVKTVAAGRKMKEVYKELADLGVILTQKPELDPEIQEKIKKAVLGLY